MRRSLANAGRMILLALFMVAIAIGSARAGSIAARVLGQPDFAHKSANGVDAQSLTINNSHGGVAVDSAGHLYVTDLNNNRVLGWHNVAALVNDEPVDLVIGQPDFFTGAAPANATASDLSNPQGVAVDSAGNVYVADTSHSRVLIFPNPFTTMSQTGQTAGFTATAALGQVGDFTSGGCNIGASGAASPDTLCLPDDVAVDASNNVYVVDSANNRVVEYDAPVSGATIGANRVFGQLGSFITNGANAGGTVSKDNLKLPTSVAVDKNNNLYVVDFGNNRVLEYNTPRTTTIIAGSGDSSADEVWGQGNNFTNSTCNNGGVSASSLCFPIKVALDSSGNLFVSDTSSNRVLEYDEGANPPTNLTATRVFGQSNFTSTGCNKGAVSPTSATLCPATGLALDSSGDLFALDGNNNRVLEYKTPLTTDTTADIVLAEPDFVHTNDTINPSSLSSPKQVAIDPSSGAIAVADTGNHRVLGWRHAASFVNGAPADLVIGQTDFYSGQLNRTGSSPAANTLWSPSGVAFDSAGNLYIGDTLNSRVVEYNAPFAACAGVFPCVGGSANLIIGQSSATVSTCNGGGSPSSATLCQPTQVNVDSFGNLYVADFGNNRVLEYNTPLTVVSAVAGSGDSTADLVFGQGATGTGTDFTTSDCNQSLSALTATSMCDPQGVSTDPTGNVYISDTKNDRILEFNETVNANTAPINVTANAVFGQNGSFTNNLLLATGADALDMPFGLSFDGSGNLYAADEVNNRVVEFFTPLTSTAILGSGDTIADILWGQGGNMVSSGCNVGGPVPSAATLCAPFSVAVDSADNVYISDTSNNRITAYSLPFTPPGADVQSDSSGILEIKPASIRFAGTRVGKRRVRHVTLTNSGSAPVQIDNLYALGDFTYLNGCPSQLMPGSSCEVQITFAPVAAGRRGGVVAIGDDARFSPHRIELSGHAKKRRGAR